MTERTLVIDVDKFLDANMAALGFRKPPLPKLEADVPEVIYGKPRGVIRTNIVYNNRRYAELADGSVVELKTDVAKPRPGDAAYTVVVADGKIDRSSCYDR